MIENLKSSIMNSEFNEAKQILLKYNEKEVENIMIGIAHDLDNIGVYFLILDIISEKNTAFWHGLASTILSTAFCYFPGAYHIAFKHMEQATVLDPFDISYKEGILLFYSIPERLLDSKKAYRIAKEILENNDTNNTAKDIIKRINNEYK